MISYKQWKLLNESLGTYSLGLRSPTNLGFVSPYHTVDDEANLEEMGMTHKLKMPMYMDDDGPPMKGKGKKPFPPHPHDMGDDMDNPDDMDDQELGPTDDTGDGLGDDDMDDDDMDHHHHHHIDPDDDMDDDDMGDDTGDDMGDEDGDMDTDAGDTDDMGGPPMHGGPPGGHPFPPKKKSKHPMGQPHPGGPFMNFSKRMKAEDCGGDHEKGKEDEEGDELVGKGDKGKELAFLQKKTMKKKMAAGDTAAKETKLGKPGFGGGKSAPKGNVGAKHGTPEKQGYSTGKTMASHSAKAGKTDAGFKKGCSTGDDGKIGMCKKCKKQKKNMKEGYSDYSRPPQHMDNSDEAFLSSLKRMYGNPTERFSDGLRDVSEDLLLHPDLMPGQPGYPQPLHNHNEQPNIAESIDSLHKRIADLEKQLKRK